MSRELLSKALAELDNADSFGVPGLKPLINDIQDELAKPEPKLVGYVPRSIVGKEYNTAFCSEHLDPDVDQIPVYAEPPKRKPLSDDDFLQWLLTHNNDTHALNFATVDVSTTGGKWKLHGWVKKLKTVIEEFYGINAPVYTHPPAKQKPLSDSESNLYEALKCLVEQTRDGMGLEYDDGEWPALDKAREALAKAKGYS